MLFGAEQRGKIIDELTEYLHENYGGDNENLNDIRERAKKAIEKSQSNNQRYFLKHHTDAKKFEIGDLVVIKHRRHGGQKQKVQYQIQRPILRKKIFG